MCELIRITATSPLIQATGSQTTPRRNTAIQPVMDGERVNEAATFRRAVLKYMGMGHIAINTLEIAAPELEINGKWYFAMGEWSRIQYS